MAEPVLASAAAELVLASAASLDVAPSISVTAGAVLITFPSLLVPAVFPSWSARPFAVFAIPSEYLIAFVHFLLIDSLWGTVFSASLLT
jgi:hypothetical protein